jgi:hypothetical protein
MDGMKPKENPKRQIDTYNPLDSVTQEPNHVNGLRRSRENEVMDQWKYMMIKPLVDINTIIYTPMEC